MTGVGGGWDDAVVVWNGVVASVRPLVVQPSSSSDVAEAIGFAREHGLLLKITGAAAENEGACVDERCLTLDLSRMQDVYVSSSPAGRR